MYAFAKITSLVMETDAKMDVYVHDERVVLILTSLDLILQATCMNMFGDIWYQNMSSCHHAHMQSLHAMVCVPVMEFDVAHTRVVSSQQCKCIDNRILTCTTSYTSRLL